MLSYFLDGVLAQLVEHHNGIVGVRGSNPLGSMSEASDSHPNHTPEKQEKPPSTAMTVPVTN